jgi:hypothetical protein
MTACRDCGQPTRPYHRVQGRCRTCDSRWRRAARQPADDGRRELWTVEGFPSGHYVLARGQWWCVAARPNGWGHRTHAPGPAAGRPDARRVSPEWEGRWLAWLGVPELN